MSRANLQHALDFCEFCWREVSMNEYATNYLNVTIANLNQALAQPEPVLNIWREAVLDQCAIAHMPFHEDNPKKTINGIIDWHVQVATDPILEQPKPEPSPKCDMTLGDRIAHVGGRTNAAGYTEFGSPMAVNALIQHVLRDVAAPATPDAIVVHSMQLDDMTAQRDKLLEELADMTAERYAWERGFEQVTNSLALTVCRRLDAQRWQTLMSSPLLEPHSTEILAAIDKAIATGGQP